MREVGRERNQRGRQKKDMKRSERNKRDKRFLDRQLMLKYTPGALTIIRKLEADKTWSLQDRVAKAEVEMGVGP